MDFNEADDDTNTSVDLAVRLGNVVLLKELLQQGYPTNGRNNMGRHPLNEAAAGGHVECVRLLLEADAEVDAMTYEGLTALYLACEPGECHTEVVKLLLCAGADPNMKCRNDCIPLSKDVLNNLYDIVKLLLDAGGNPNRKDFRYGAPLVTAAAKGHLKIAQLLVERGAKVDFQDNSGHTAIQFLLLQPRHLLEDSTIIPFLDLLVNGGLDINARLNTLKLKVNAGLPPDVFLQVTSSADLYNPDPQTLDEEDVEWLDETDIRLYCQAPMVKDLGIEVDTPLGFLLSKPLNKKRVEMAKLMIDKGSNVNVVVPRFLPPLVVIVMYQEDRYNHGCPGLDILEHLLNNGADVMHKISPRDILPAALHISSLLNVQAFLALLVRCIPVHEIYTPWTLESLSQFYAESVYYNVDPLCPWRIISWLNVVNAFVPQLPLDTKNTFDIKRMVEDDNLSRAWDDLDAQIGSPKKLEQLCILTVRRVVGERNGWNRLPKFLGKLTLMNEPLRDLIMDLLTFKQMESSLLSKWPPLEVMSLYVLSASNHCNDEYDP